MYRIVGEDGKEYGPVSLEEIRRWLIEGRVNADTMVMPEGGTRWQKLREYPELAGPAGQQPSKAAETLVSTPAIGLIVAGALNIIGALIGVVLNLAGMNRIPFEAGNAPPGFNPEMFRMFSGGMGAVFNLIGLAIGVLIILGALKMKKLESREWSMASAILAIVPCSLCCIVGLIFGIWALVVLNKPEVKNAFR